MPPSGRRISRASPVLRCDRVDPKTKSKCQLQPYHKGSHSYGLVVRKNIVKTDSRRSVFLEGQCRSIGTIRGRINRYPRCTLITGHRGKHKNGRDAW